MIRKVGLLAVAFAFAACSTVATTVGFPAADADDDDALSNAEFHEFFDDTDAFERFDDNDDGSLNRTEYNEAVDDAYEGDSYWTGLNGDNNDRLSREEFIGGWFKMFDADRNNMLTRSEFENAIESLSVEF
jgi:Ca2+-binding EF-hand superfamily protein